MEISEKSEILKVYLEDAKAVIDKRNQPIYDRLAEIECAKQRETQKLDNKFELYSHLDLRDPKNKPIRDLIERARDEYVLVIQEYDAEEHDLRDRLIHHIITDGFIDSWLKYAKRISKGMALFTFAEKRDAIESLGITGSPIIEDGKKYLIVYICGSFAESLPLDSFARHLKG